MPQLIRDNAIVDNEWLRVEDGQDLNSSTDSPVLVPLSLWIESQEQLLSQQRKVGVTITSTDDLSLHGESIAKLPIIEVFFPAFMDGRGFSLGRILRERYNFSGELRAGGNFIRDQLCYLRRCGFNAFHFDDKSIDLKACLDSLHDFSNGYQPSVDQPLPLFARRD